MFKKQVGMESQKWKISQARIEMVLMLAVTGYNYS